MTLARRLTPVMGWNSWNAFRTQITEDLILTQADLLISTGLADAGYRMLVVDDGWQAARRDTNGDLQSCPQRFPSGIAYLASEIHARGLDFGLYLAPGRRTCAQYWDGFASRRYGDVARRPSTLTYLRSRLGIPPAPQWSNTRDDLGSWRREKRDIERLASWGVDYLKYDWCQAEQGTSLSRHCPAFVMMADLIADLDRPITYSISEYGEQDPASWAPAFASSWRTTGDIAPRPSSVFRIARETATHHGGLAPGQFPDPDMLQIGNLDARATWSHMALWSFLSAPLFIGTDLRHLADETYRVLTDRQLLEMNQGPVSPVRLIDSSSGIDSYTRVMDGVRYLLRINTHRRPAILHATGEVIVNGVPVHARGTVTVPGLGGLLRRVP